jgi:hypothetical protein
MKLLSAPVLGGAALVSSPAWWAAFVEGTRGPDFALTRYLVSVLLCWLALEVVAMIVGPVERTAEPADDPADPSD